MPIGYDELTRLDAMRALLRKAAAEERGSHVGDMERSRIPRAIAAYLVAAKTALVAAYRRAGFVVRRPGWCDDED